MTIRERVFASLDDAVRNGFIENFDITAKLSIYDCDPLVLAEDVTYWIDNETDEEVNTADLVEFCTEWQNLRRPK